MLAPSPRGPAGGSAWLTPGAQVPCHPELPAANEGTLDLYHALPDGYISVLQ
jgi:hypothetical protein